PTAAAPAAIEPAPTEPAAPVSDEIEGPAAWEDDVSDPTDDDAGMVLVDEYDDLPASSTIAAAAPASRASPQAAPLPWPEDVRAQDWPALAQSLPLSGTAAELALNSEWVSGRGNEIRLRVAIRSFAEGTGRDRLRTVLSEHFGQVVQLAVEVGDTGEDTAYAVGESVRAERQERAEQAVRDDDVVRALMHDFDARVVPDSIRPPAV
ncbi:MAG: DNA polymerase III subunit gamma/tau, partial [Alcaligenaceae bacterium]|nr:DNA polymerase III subunit gamma/tau [Alcaligenaceae bacterium]